MSSTVCKLFIPDANALPIIHPETKSLGRIWIPFQFIVRTSGVDRYLNNHPHAPSLCMLYQNGRCNSGSKCNQIHVDKSFANAVREALAFTAVSNCCLSHGDLASTSNNLFELSQPESIELRREGSPVVFIPREKIGVTLFWYRFLKQKRRVLFFTPDRVCNLHQQNVCKYGVECKNVHLCRELWSEICGIPMYSPFDSISTSSLENFSSQPNENEDFAPEASAGEETCEMVSIPIVSKKALVIVDPKTGSEVFPLPSGRKSKPTKALPIVNPFSGQEIILETLVRESSSNLQLDQMERPQEKIPVQNESLALSIITFASATEKMTLNDNNTASGFSSKKMYRPKSSEELNKMSEMWLEKSEASRGKFKNIVASNLLGVLSTKGPNNGSKGFGMGRGVVARGI